MGHLFLLLLALLVCTHATSFHAKAAFNEVSEDKSIAGIRGVIGSRPPSCAGRCRSCGHCEAVQVPVSPQELQKRRSGEKDDREKMKKKLGRHGNRAAAGGGGRSTMPSSYDDHSNYKPLSWRCKCGGLILNP